MQQQLRTESANIFESSDWYNTNAVKPIINTVSHQNWIRIYGNPGTFNEKQANQNQYGGNLTATTKAKSALPETTSDTTRRAISNGAAVRKYLRHWIRHMYRILISVRPRRHDQ